MEERAGRLGSIAVIFGSPGVFEIPLVQSRDVFGVRLHLGMDSGLLVDWRTRARARDYGRSKEWLCVCVCPDLRTCFSSATVMGAICLHSRALCQWSIGVQRHVKPFLCSRERGAALYSHEALAC